MGPRSRRGELALALLLCTSAAHALTLGDIQVRSALGEPLDARIPVIAAPGEWFGGRCFALASDAVSGAPRISEAYVAVERSAAGAWLRIRSAQPVAEPASNMRVTIACPGTPATESQEYAVLLDPRIAPTPPTVAAATPAVSASPEVTSNLGARPGDTLESIAATMFPRNRFARGAYLEALRAANPAIASRGEREPIGADEVIALPDLHTFAQARHSARPSAAAPRAPSIAAEAPALAVEPKPIAPKAAKKESAPRKEPALPKAQAQVAQKAAPVTSRKVASAASGRSSPGFQLKLSAPEMDLSPSRTIDDRLRNQLRERLLMLDADDQVAAMLSMRNSLKQLEARVAELQLKLSGMPPSLVAGKAETPPPKPEPKVEAKPEPKVEPKVEAKPEPRVEPKVEPAAPPKVEAPLVIPAPPAAKVEAAPATASTEESTPAPPPVKAEPPKAQARAIAKPAPAPTDGSALPEWLWSVVALFVVLVILIAWYLVRRSRRERVEEEDEFSLAPPPEAGPGDDEIAPHAEAFAEEPMVIEHPQRAEIASDAELTTRIPVEDAEDLRRRYIEERFPEIVTRMIVLEDPDSVVKGARLFYEDGAVTRAVELLQFAISGRPEEIKTWLALFEIFRLERLTGEFADLARRFQQHHGQSEHWRKVQYFGREIDPGNALYQEEAPNTLETIGPREARRFAAAAAGATSFDPIEENWLNAPMDFENEVLANELRKALMAQAGLSEQDLVPNPMPALRNIEMFTVA